MISNRETMGSPYSFSFGRDSYNLKVIHFQIPLNCRWNLTHFGIKFNRSSPNGLQWMKPILWISQEYQYIYILQRLWLNVPAIFEYPLNISTLALQIFSNYAFGPFSVMRVYVINNGTGLRSLILPN